MSRILNYFKNYQQVLDESVKENIQELDHMVELIDLWNKSHNDFKIILIGNGGSAAIANHMVTDFTKNAKIKAVSLNDSSILTVFANDYGYENMFKEWMKMNSNEHDLLIAISSGGESKNILNAVDYALEKDLKIFTFTGFEENNSVKKLGNLNVWVNSTSYGYVEMAHHLFLHYINDSIIGKSHYKIT